MADISDKGETMKAFIEFGAHTHPNLTDLLKNGWHGILVEPHPFHFVKLYEFLLTLGDISFDAYLGIVTAKEGDIVVFKSGSASFLEGSIQSGTQSSTWNSGFWLNHNGPGAKIVSITLDRLIRECPYPVERFEIDCEGMEIDIFENYSWIKKPEFIKVALHGINYIDRLRSAICVQGYEQVDNIPNDLCFRKI